MHNNNSNRYNPSIFFKSGHVNTIFPTLFDWKIKKRSRERKDTDDGDYYYIDWLRNNNRRLVILLHGLEGSSDSSYIKRASHLLSDNNWDVCGLNFRSCMGPISACSKLYHSGFTEDLHDVILSNEYKYDEIFLVGYSLGGNAMMKYMGERIGNLSPKIKAVMGVSVPCDLAGCSRVLSRGFNRLYDRNFLKSLMSKMKAKNELIPEIIRFEQAPPIKYLIDFDDYFTGPLHGFKNAEDYYRQCNCLQFINKIDRSAYMINALDDPLLSDACYPYEAARENSNFILETPKHGGHVGYADFRQKYYWIDYKILNFVESISELN